MQPTCNIAAYSRISEDDDLRSDNTSIEHQQAIIADYVKRNFPGSTLDFHEDRDLSGYTFEQRKGYQALRPRLMDLSYDILVVKDFSRFARRNSRGLVELEDLRDAGVRIISIGDSIDYPTHDNWTAIQFLFLINEMPVTETSKKVKAVISHRQREGRWICSVPYGYVITNSKTMVFEVDESAAEVVRLVFQLYNEGWGYKKIANHLTDKNIPTPRMSEQMRKEARGEEYKGKVRPEWSIVTVSGILSNDFYIGTLRQGKYKRKKINGSDEKIADRDHVVFENNHEPIIDYRTFAVTQEELKIRSTTNYRGVKKKVHAYTGSISCGDCSSPMFPTSRRDLRPAYTCGAYHRRGLKGCTSHYTRVDVLDELIKDYIHKVKDNSAEMLDKLNEALKNEQEIVKDSTSVVELLQGQIEEARAEVRILARQQAKEILRNPERESVIEETYQEVLDELSDRIDGLSHQMELAADRRNTVIRVNRITKTALDIFDDILEKEKLDKTDLQLIIEGLVVYEDKIEIQLKADIDTILKTGTLPEKAVNFELGTGNIENECRGDLQSPAGAQSAPLQTAIIQRSTKHKDKVLSVHVIGSGDPLEIYTEKDGEVIFKKYSPMGELADFAGQICETLSKTTGCITAVCDRDTIISISGAPRKELLERRISGELEQIMEGRQVYVLSPGEGLFPAADGTPKYGISIAAPILSEGDVMGCVMFLITDAGQALGEVEHKLAQTVAGFLGRQMEH
ncbi:MAG: recombinase family protein [Oscillospiraceae bacterium]|nr:recombinase family protein [Oscillospiraceae bacterium]